MIKCELCGKEVKFHHPYEYKITRTYYECNGWKTAVDKYVYAHKDCIVECKK